MRIDKEQLRDIIDEALNDIAEMKMAGELEGTMERDILTDDIYYYFTEVMYNEDEDYDLEDENYYTDGPTQDVL